MDKKILISCPVHQREWILPYYLESLYNLDYNKKNIDIFWIVNNSTDDSFKLLQEFKSKYIKEYNSINIGLYNNSNLPSDSRNTKTRHKIYPWLSELRNKILKKCVDLNCDFLFSSDCDIVLRNDSLKRLLSHNLPIVSSLIYNGYVINDIETAYKYPNILKETTPRKYKHICNSRIKNPNNNELNKLIEVDYTGACIIISKDVCSKTKYNTSTYGEDEPWCFSCRENGFKLYCDISLFNYHAMSQNVLEYFINNNLIKLLTN